MKIIGENGLVIVHMDKVYFDKAIEGDGQWRSIFLNGFNGASIALGLKVFNNFEEATEFYLSGGYDIHEPIEELSLAKILDLGCQGKLPSLTPYVWERIYHLVKVESAKVSYKGYQRGVRDTKFTNNKGE